MCFYKSYGWQHIAGFLKQRMHYFYQNCEPVWMQVLRIKGVQNLAQNVMTASGGGPGGEAPRDVPVPDGE